MMPPHQIREAIAGRWPVVLPLGVLEYHSESSTSAQPKQPNAEFGRKGRDQIAALLRQALRR